jgi:hypothetical protein
LITRKEKKRKEKFFHLHIQSPNGQGFYPLVKIPAYTEKCREWWLGVNQLSEKQKITGKSERCSSQFLSIPSQRRNRRAHVSRFSIPLSRLSYSVPFPSFLFRHRTWKPDRRWGRRRWMLEIISTILDVRSILGQV